MFFAKKIFKMAIVIFFLIALFLVLVWKKDFSHGTEPEWGVSFSKKYAEQLGLNWKKAYLDILDELGVKRVRIPMYWNEVEKEKEQYDFSEIEWQLQEAQKRGAKVLLVIGRRQPRWPECHDPAWVSSLSSEEVEQKVLDLIREEIQRFGGYENISGWQLENEPLLSVFGTCPKPDAKFLEKEIAFLDTLETNSLPIIITDSGELSFWLRTSQLTRMLGTTVYRKVWNKHFGDFKYFFLPPAWYYYKAEIIKTISKTNLVFISEMQMEPWVPLREKSIQDMDRKVQKEKFGAKDFREHIDFAKRTGLSPIYLWGVEWWYWLDAVHGDAELWEEAKRVF